MKEKTKKIKQQRETDHDYIAYAKSGESAAVFIMRDISCVDTGGKWIAISQLETENTEFSFEPEMIRKGQWHTLTYNSIKSFTCELFPRITKPDYSNCETDEDINYVTWLTATEDIARHRLQGHVGRKYSLKIETVPYLVPNPEPDTKPETMPHIKCTYKIKEIKRINP